MLGLWAAEADTSVVQAHAGAEPQPAIAVKFATASTFCIMSL